MSTPKFRAAPATAFRFAILWLSPRGYGLWKNRRKVTRVETNQTNFCAPLGVTFGPSPYKLPVRVNLTIHLQYVGDAKCTAGQIGT